MRYIFLLVLIPFLQGCAEINCMEGDGDQVLKEYDLSGFHSIALRQSADVILTKGNTYMVKVDGGSNIFEDLHLEVVNEELIIDANRCIRNNGDFHIYVQMPELRKAAVAGSGSIVSSDTFTSSLMQLRVSGSGDIWLAVDAERIESSVGGSGNIRLQGQTNRFDCKISGSGDVEAFELTCHEAEVSISGSGRTEITVDHDLLVSLNGSGSVIYEGAPEIKKSVSGSGEVREKRSIVD